MRQLCHILRTVLACCALVQALTPSCPCRWFAAPRAITTASRGEMVVGHCCGHSHQEPSKESDERTHHPPDPAPCECPHRHGGPVLTAIDPPQFRVTPGVSDVGEHTFPAERPSLINAILQIGITESLHSSAQIRVRLQV